MRHARRFLGFLGDTNLKNSNLLDIFHFGTRNAVDNGGYRDFFPVLN